PPGQQLLVPSQLLLLHLQALPLHLELRGERLDLLLSLFHPACLLAAVPLPAAALFLFPPAALALLTEAADFRLGLGALPRQGFFHLGAAAGEFLLGLGLAAGERLLVLLHPGLEVGALLCEHLAVAGHLALGLLQLAHALVVVADAGAEGRRLGF